jgi:hypothetical protein
MGSQHKKKKGTDDTRIIIADVKDDVDLWSNRGALQPSYEGDTYIVQSRTMIDFVNVTESIDPAQTGGSGGGPGAPAQVTGLGVSVISDSQLNLSWTAVAPPVDNYKVYSSTVSGFTPTSPIGTPVPNSYSSLGLSSGTTYYYKVSAVNSTGEGTVSTQASGTTTGTPPPAGTAPPPSDLFMEPNPGDPSTQGINYFSAVTFSPAVTQYQFQYSVDPTFATGLQFNYATAHPYPSGAGMTLLTPNTVYYGRVRCVNSNGNGSFSGVVSMTTAP